MSAPMKTNLSFEANADVERAMNAHDITARSFASEFNVKGCTSGFDVDSGEVLIFFPLYYLYAFTQADVNRYFSDLKNNWENADFMIVEEAELSANEYAAIGFSSKYFRLQSLT